MNQDRLTQVKAVARIESSKAAIHYNVLGCLERALLLIAHANWIIHAGSAALGHENGDLSRQLCQLKGTCTSCKHASLMEDVLWTRKEDAYMLLP